MGIGLLEFKRQFAAELTALAAERLTASVVGRQYVNAALGIAFTCPADWTIADIREVQRVAEGRMVNSHEDDLNDCLRAITAEHLPLVVVAAPALDAPIARLGPHELRPLIALHVEEPILLHDQDDFSLVRHVRDDLALFHAHMEDYRLLTAVEETTLSACEAVSYLATYTTFHADAAAGCPTRERTWYFRKGSFVYAFRFCDYPDRDPRLAHNFDAVIASIRLA